MRTWKKRLALGLVILVAGSAGVGLLVYRSVSRVQSTMTRCFAAVCDADGDALRGLMVPNAAAQFDDPLLASFAAELKKRLGKYKGVKAYRALTRITDSRTPTRRSCLLEFEKGTARGTLEILDGKVLNFSIHSTLIPKGWSPTLADTPFWRTRGQEFLTAYVEGDAAKAHGMMHPELQAMAPLEQLRADVAGIPEKSGKLVDVQVVSEEADPSGKACRIRYRVKWEKNTADILVALEAIGMRVYVMALEPSTEEDADANR